MSITVWLTALVDLGGKDRVEFEVWEWNVTHNLSQMWRAAGIFNEIYNSEGVEASEVVDRLNHGLRMMTHHPEAYRALEPSNGWGTYENAIEFIGNFIEACNEYPKAVIAVCK